MRKVNPNSIFSTASQPTNVEAANKWLESAIRGKNLPDVKQALIIRANPNQLFGDDSALTLAVKSGSLEIVQELVIGGADINLVNKKFESAIDIAGDMKNFEIHQYLIEQRKLFNETVFDDIIISCSEGFQHLTGETPERENLTLIAHYASRLTGVNIGELFSGKNTINYRVCLAHLLSLEDAKFDGEELDGWKAQQYLAVYIHFLLEIYIKLRVGAMNHISADRKSQVELELWIRNEILTNLESLRLLGDRISICDNYSRPQLSELYRALSRSIVEKINHMGHSKEIMIVGGYKGHTLYISFSNRKNSDVNYIDIRVDNVGALSSSHNEKKEKRVVTLQPHHIGSFKLDVFFNRDEFKDYIVGLFEAKLLSNSSQDKNEAEHKIYDKSKTLDSLKSQLPLLDYPYSREQIADNCVTECHKVGMLIRSRTPAQHRWILAQQVKVAADPVRAEAARAVGDPKYWANNIVPTICEYSGNIPVWALPCYQRFISPLLVLAVPNLQPRSDSLHKIAREQLLLAKKVWQREEYAKYPHLYRSGSIQKQEQFDVTDEEISNLVNRDISHALMNPRSMKEDLIREYPILGLIQAMFNFQPTLSADRKKRVFEDAKKFSRDEQDKLLRAILNFCYGVTLLIEGHNNPRACFNYEAIEAFNAVCAYDVEGENFYYIQLFSKINIAMLYFRVQQYSKALDFFLECENTVLALVEAGISSLVRNGQEFEKTNYWIDVSRMIDLCKGFIYIIKNNLDDANRSFENILSSVHYEGFTQEERFQSGYSYDQKYKKVKIDDKLPAQANFGLAKVNFLYYSKDEADLGFKNLQDAVQYIGVAQRTLHNVPNVRSLYSEIAACLRESSELALSHKRSKK